MNRYSLIGGTSAPISAVGRYFKVLSAVDELTVRISARGKQIYYGKLTSGLGINFSDRQAFPEPFDQIIVESPTDQTVTLYHELAAVDDDRLSGNFDINAALSVASKAPVNHATATFTFTGSQEVLPQRSGRIRALIQASGDVQVQDANGVTLSGLFTWENQSALTLIASGTVTVNINEDYN